MVKIGVLTSVRFVYDSRVFHKQCKSLAQAGFDVTYIVPHDHDEVKEGVKIKAVPKPLGRVARMTRTVWRVYQEAVVLDADLYHFHDAELIPIALLLCAIGKRVVYDVHDDAPQGLRDKYYIPTWLRMPLVAIATLLENTACRFFVGMTVAVPGLAAKYGKVNPKTVVIHNFPLLHEMPTPATTSWDQRLPAIIYFGALSEERRIFEVIEMMARIDPALGVTIKMGGLFAPLSLREQVNTLPGWNRVCELGYVDRQAVAKGLAEAMLGVVFVQDEPRYRDAYPVKMFEYMAAGLPVVATDFPLWRAILEGNRCGIVADSGDPSAMAKAVEYLVTHPSEAEAMGRRGREAVEKKYRWESEEKKLVDFFSELTQ